MSFGAALASCLHLFKGRCGAGLIASSKPYDDLLLPSGSNPITDPLMSGDRFEIVHDGAAFSRAVKVAAIGQWRAGVEALRSVGRGRTRIGTAGRVKSASEPRARFWRAGFPCQRTWAEHRAPTRFTESGCRRIGRSRNGGTCSGSYGPASPTRGSVPCGGVCADLRPAGPSRQQHAACGQTGSPNGERLVTAADLQLLDRLRDTLHHTLAGLGALELRLSSSISRTTATLATAPSGKARWHGFVRPSAPRASSANRQLQQRAAARGLETQGGPSAPRRRQSRRSLPDAPGVPGAHPRRISRPSRRPAATVDAVESDRALASARQAFGRHKRFSLLVREKRSFDIARREFQCDVRLCPDMAFALPRFRGLRRRGTSWSSRERTRNRGWIRQWSSITGRLTGCVTIRRLPFHSNGARDIGRRGGACAGGCTAGLC